MPVKYSDYRKNTSEILDERRKIAEYNKQFPEEVRIEKDPSILGTIGHIGSKFVSGTAKGLEGIVDAGAPLLKSIGTITSFGGDREKNPIYLLGDKMIKTRVGEGLENILDDYYLKRSYIDNEHIGSKIAEGVGRINAALIVGKAVGNKGLKFASVNSTSKGAAVVNNMISQINNPTMQAFLLDIYGSSYADAVNNGATDDEAGLFALVETAKEGGIEMISGGVGGIFGKGAIDDYVTDGLVKLTKNKLAQMGIKTVTTMLGEGAEEVLAELIEPFTNYIYKHKLDFSNYNNLFEVFLVGSLVSGTLQGGRAIRGKITNPNTSVYEQIMGEYIDDLSTDVDTYTNAQQEILNRIDDSVNPDEILELNEANTVVASTIEELKLRLEQLTALQKPSTNSSAEKIPDVLKVVPDTTQTDANIKGTEYETISTKPIKLNDTEYTVKDFTVESDVDNNVKSKQLNLINNKTNVTEGYVKYNVNGDNEIHVEYIKTYDDYRGQGVGRQLAVELQNIAGDREIYVDKVTGDGKTFWPKVANLTQYKTGAYGVPYYKGKVKTTDTKKSAPATKKQTTKTVGEKKRGTITKDQIKTIHTLLGKDGKLKEEVYKEFGIKSSTELSKEKASELIERLNSGQSRSDKIAETRPI